MWTAGLICVGLIPVAVIGFFALFVWEKWNEGRVQARLKESGQVVKGWIVFANDQLYLKNSPKNMWDAQVVFTLDPKLEKRDGYLAKMAEEVRDFEVLDPDEHDERVIGQILRSHVGYNWPLRIPERITGKAAVYTITISVDCSLLPGNKLTIPYIYCRVLLDPEKHSKGEARMMAYPDDEQKAIIRAANAQQSEF